MALSGRSWRVRSCPGRLWPWCAVHPKGQRALAGVVAHAQHHHVLLSSSAPELVGLSRRLRRVLSCALFWTSTDLVRCIATADGAVVPGIWEEQVAKGDPFDEHATPPQPQAARAVESPDAMKSRESKAGATELLILSAKDHDKLVS